MGNIPSIQIFERGQEDDLSDQSSTPMRTVQLGKAKVLHARWVHNNQSIFTASDDGAVRVYDAETGKMTAESQPHRGAISRINFDKYEGTFLTASKDGTAKVCFFHFKFHVSLFQNADVDIFFFFFFFFGEKLLDSKTLHVLKSYDTGRPINCAVISPIKDHIIIGGGEEAQNVTTTKLDSSQFRVRFFHKVYGNEICSILGHFGTVNTVAISPDGKRFVFTLLACATVLFSDLQTDPGDPLVYSFASGAEDGYVRLHHMPEEYINMDDH
jgi:translation initiation factor 3 subunit I